MKCEGDKRRGRVKEGLLKDYKNYKREGKEEVKKWTKKVNKEKPNVRQS